MFEIVWVVEVVPPMFPFAVEVLPYLKTMRDDSEISADAVPFRLALALEF